MPFTLPTLISARANRFPSRSPTSSTRQRMLYFPPGGHTHDRHTIPPDRLHISLSDPVLVAAEQRLSSVSNAQRWSRLLVIKDADTEKTARPGSVVFHLKKGGILSQRSGDYNDSPLVPEPVNPLAMVLDTPGTGQEHCWKAGFQGAAAHLLDSSDNSCDISEVMTISVIDGSSGNARSADPENGRYGSDLAPLASEMLKEELYTRGYLKRPANRPSSTVPRKPRISLVFLSRKVFPKVLGRRQGHKVAEYLRTGQGTIETSGGLDAYFSEKQSFTSVTLRTPHADGVESPGVDTNTSASESLDLHEFSYITAFTTLPSSPSIILDAETFKKGVDLADSKHDCIEWRCCQCGVVPMTASCGRTAARRNEWF